MIVNLTKEELTLILKGLSELKYKDTYKLMSKLVLELQSAQRPTMAHNIEEKNKE